MREQNLDGQNIRVHEEGTANVNVLDSNHQPFQTHLNAFLDDGEFDGSASYTVPAGKRLVVQYLSVSAGVPPDEGVSIDFVAGSDPGSVPLLSGGLQRK